MSRNYKRYCVSKDKNSQFGKNQASRAVRRFKNIPNGNTYKKYYCSWNICEYRIFEPKISKKEFQEKWNKSEDDYRRKYQYHNWKEAYRKWKTYYICK